MKMYHLKSMILILAFVVLSGLSHSQQQKLSIRESFENAENLVLWKKKEASARSFTGKSNQFARSGQYSYRFELNRDFKLGSVRAELALDREALVGVERWYKFSILYPSANKVDPAHEILAQWHDIPDFRMGEKWRSPAISLQVTDGRWLLYVKWATNPVNTNATISGKKLIDLGAVEGDQWVDWKIFIKFSWLDDGLIRIWKNGKLYETYSGPNYYNDKSGPYFKIGIYKSEWGKKATKSTASNRVVFFDNVWVDKTDIDPNNVELPFNKDRR